MIIRIAEAQETISSPHCVYTLLSAFMQEQDAIDRDKEHFFCLHLTARHRIKLAELITVGTLNASLVHPREVFTRAVAERSASLVLAHNHPSEVLDPSREDIAITRQLAEAGTILGIAIVDHIIIASTGFYSFKEHGLL